MTPDKSDQWKSDGDCTKCRRNGYCSKACKARHKFLYGQMVEQLKKKLKGENDGG